MKKESNDDVNARLELISAEIGHRRHTETVEKVS